LCENTTIHQLPKTALMIGPDAIISSTAVRDLGIHIDSDLGMQTGCSADRRWLLCSSASAAQCTTFCSPICLLHTPVVVLVLSPLDHGKARIPRHRYRHPREEIARVGRKDVGVSGNSVSMAVSWNAGLTPLWRAFQPAY